MTRAPQRDSPPPGDRVRVSVAVGVDPPDAFEIFTAEIDRWWRRGQRFRPSAPSVGVLHLEAGVGGRLFEAIEGPPPGRRIQLGHVTVWEPPRRLVFEWRGINFAPGETTEVEVRFESSPTGTLVTLEHRGWSGLRPDHPARHGLAVPGFVDMMGRWWGDLLTSLREHATRGGALPGDGGAADVQ